jgi:phospholipase C
LTSTSAKIAVKATLTDILRRAKSKFAQSVFSSPIQTRSTAMTEEPRGSTATADYLICRSTEADDYSIWRVDLHCEQLLHRVTGGAETKLDRKHQLISIGNYILEWGPIILQDYTPNGVFPYRLLEFDPNDPDPLGTKTAKVVTKGTWPKLKFWKSRPDFGNPDGAAKAYNSGEKLMLLPLGTFILNIIPTTGRGTFRLFSFDPGSIDPLYEFPTWTYGSFLKIQFGHELIPLGDYVLDRVPATGEYSLWSFDPMKSSPLLPPPVQKGRWKDIDATHRLIPIGEHVLDWDMGKARYRLWCFDPKSDDPLGDIVGDGPMPEAFGMTTTLTGHQALRPIDDARKNHPGTIDFMRTKIKHIVYYMLENRSFDHVCGWLYEKSQADINFVGSAGPFEGANSKLFNIDPEAPGDSNKVYLQTYDKPRNPRCDPYHDMTDTLRQLFFENPDGYADGEDPDMGGFVRNNGVHDVMMTFKPEQLPVLTGLAEAFAVSDKWFCSMPGATDANRAFALTGSALGQLNNFMNNPQYTDWPDSPLRGSIWKLLWANGKRKWKIYNSIPWQSLPLTYQLFLKGQIPTVDAPNQVGNYVADFDQFMKDARDGQLPDFSFLEPVWIMSAKPATSYHPAGGENTAHGEQALNEIYEALKASPAWDETLLIITFDEHGGFYDHVPPPCAENPWPQDVVDGFRYDRMGVRVPTILVSPLIKKHTVFRSKKKVAYDSTSILATLLHWYGIPKARWALGARTHHAPTFEDVFELAWPRTDKPKFTPLNQPLATEWESQTPSEQHQVMLPRLVHAMLDHKRSARESCDLANEILSRARDVKTLHLLMDDLVKRRS